MIRIGSIVLRIDDLERQSAFWMAALDYLPREETSDDFVLIRPKNGVGPNVSPDRHHSTLQLPPRIHLDLLRSMWSEGHGLSSGAACLVGGEFVRDRPRMR
jgi:hypothetical protein